MTRLPRLLAVTSDAICQAPDFASRAVAIMAVGPAVGLVVRAPGLSAAAHAGVADCAARLAGPSGAKLLIHGRPDIARAVGAHGVQLRHDDLSPSDARRVLGEGWIGISVHSRTDAETAIAAGADFVVAGNLFETASHPGRPAQGLAWLAELCALDRPVLAIGGITPARAALVRQAGAWGVAVITALWEAADPGAAARALLAPWEDAA